MSKPTITEKLIEFESMLHASVQRVGRAVANLHQSLGGYGSKTPGSGEPGAGKNARATVHIKDGRDPVVHRQLSADPLSREIVETVVEDGSFAVPVTSVEVQALGFAGIDTAAIVLDELRAEAIATAYLLARAATVSGIDPGPGIDHLVVTTPRLVVLCYARVRRLQRFNLRYSDRTLERLRETDPHLGRVFQICQNWGYTPGVPSVPKDRAELLAVDLTERWCTSHLRAGERRPRFRGALCEWCYRHGPLLVATWDAPPLDLVRLHIEHGKVYAHQVEPFLRAERDRQRNRVKAGS